MANSPQAIKRARQSQARYLHNRTQRSQMRTLMKSTLKEVANGNHEAATNAFKAAVKYMDSLVNKHIMHGNTVARYKSRINAKIKSLKTAA